MEERCISVPNLLECSSSWPPENLMRRRGCGSTLSAGRVTTVLPPYPQRHLTVHAQLTPPSLPPERVRARSRLSHLAEGACPGKFHARASSALCAFFPAAGSSLFPSQLPLREQNGSPHAAEFALLIQGCRTVVSAGGWGWGGWKSGGWRRTE